MRKSVRRAKGRRGRRKRGLGSEGWIGQRGRGSRKMQGASRRGGGEGEEGVEREKRGITRKENK